MNSLKNDYYIEQGVRYAQIAAPFAAFLPGAKGVSNSSLFDIVDAGSHLFEAVQAKNRGIFVKESLRTVQSVTSSVSSKVNSLRGQYFASGIGIFVDGIQVVEDLWKKESDKLLIDFSKLISSFFAVSILITGSSNLVVASLVYKAFLQFVFAEKEWSEGKIPEAIGRFAMGVLIGSKSNEFREKSLLFEQLKDEKISYLPLFDEDAPITSDHPLYDLVNKIDKQRCILTDHEGKSYDMGASFPFMGRDLVKGMNIRFQNKDAGLELDFEVNHVHRKRLVEKLEELQGKEGFVFSDDAECNIRTVNIGDKGTLRVGTNPAINGVRPENSSDYYLYNRVKVWMPQEGGIEGFRQFLSHFNLHRAIFPSTEADVLRMKIGQIFRFYHPRQATSFEKMEEFFTLPISQLKQMITVKAPDMIRRLDQKHMDRVKPVEMSPGRVRFSMEGLGRKVKLLGVTSLSAIVTNQKSCLLADSDRESSEISYKRVADMLKMGMFAAGVREQFGIGKPGMSVKNHDCVFLQMNFSEGKNNFSQEGMYNVSGRIYLVVSSRILERMTYQNFSGIYGARGTMYDYRTRRNLFSYIQKLKRAFPWYPRHEIMIKERVPPSFIKRIIVRSDQEREGLIDYLRQCNMVDKNQEGSESVGGKRLSDFIVLHEGYHKRTNLDKFTSFIHSIVN